MKKILSALLLASGLPAAAQTFPVNDLRVTGRKDNRINLVILPDGFTAAEQTTFLTDADVIRSHAFEYTPLKEYINFFNVYAIQVPSKESGVNHPRTATDVPETDPLFVVDNYFKSTFDFGGTHRALVVGDYPAVAGVLASNLPEYDLVFVLSNTLMYGGTGGEFATGTLNSASVQVAVHEWGHTFANLADEYWAGDVFAAEKPNMTTDNNTSTNKWRNWLGYKKTGIYAYGTTSAGTWYRPHNDCMMQYLDTVLCPVCKQSFVDRIYQLVFPIDATTPDTSTAVTYSAATLPFSVKLIKPEPNTFKIKWTLNGSPTAFTDTFALISGSMLASGSNQLRVFVTDTTNLSRSYWPEAGYQFSAGWKINNSGTGIVIDKSTASKFGYKVYPVPAQDKVTLEYDNQTGSATAVFQVSDLNGRVISTQAVDLSNGKGYLNQDISGLAKGSYLLQLKAREIDITTKISVE